MKSNKYLAHTVWLHDPTDYRENTNYCNLTNTYDQNFYKPEPNNNKMFGTAGTVVLQNLPAIVAETVTGTASKTVPVTATSIATDLTTDLTTDQTNTTPENTKPHFITHTDFFEYFQNHSNYAYGKIKGCALKVQATPESTVSVVITFEHAKNAEKFVSCQNKFEKMGKFIPGFLDISGDAVTARLKTFEQLKLSKFSKLRF